MDQWFIEKKRKHLSFPSLAVKDYADILGVDKQKWRWHDRLIIKDKYSEDTISAIT